MSLLGKHSAAGIAVGGIGEGGPGIGGGVDRRLHALRQRIHLRLQVGQRGVAHVDQRPQLSGADAAGDIGGITSHGDGVVLPARQAHPRIGLADGGMGQQMGLIVQERCAAGGINLHCAIIIHIAFDVHVFVKIGQGGIALILQIGHIRSHRQTLGDLVVQIVHVGQVLIDLSNPLGDGGVGLLTQALNAGRHGVQFVAYVQRILHCRRLIGRLGRVRRQLLKASGHVGNLIGDGRTVTHRSELRLDLLIIGLQGVQLSHGRALGIQLLGQTFIDRARHPGDHHPGPLTVQLLGLQVQGLAGIAGGVDVGDVLRNRVQSILTGQQSGKCAI